MLVGLQLPVLLLERLQRSTVKLAAKVDALPASAEAWPLDD